MMRLLSIRLSITLVMFLTIVSCKKQDELTINETATRLFQDTTVMRGGNNTGGSGGGSGGGSSAEFFEFNVDGRLIQGVNPEYRPNFANSASLASHFNSLTDILGISFFTAPTAPGTIDISRSANFSFNVTTDPNDQYTAINGEVNITEVNSSIIVGTFFFDATQPTNADTISITGGRFSVNK